MISPFRRGVGMAEWFDAMQVEAWLCRFGRHGEALRGGSQLGVSVRS